MRCEFPSQEPASSPIRQTLAVSKIKVSLGSSCLAHCYGSYFNDLVLASLWASILHALYSLPCVLNPSVAEDKNFLLISLANKFYLFYLPKTLISERSFHSYLNTLHWRSENSLCVTTAPGGWNASFLSPGFSASSPSLLFYFVSGLLFFWSRTGWWETGRWDSSFRQDCRVNSDGYDLEKPSTWWYFQI